MGLDASVHCDCFERGLVRVPPQSSWKVYVDEEGGRAPGTDDVDEQIAFDAWNRWACEHEDGVVLHHRIGNIALVGLLRGLLRPVADRLPVVTGRIIHNGIHAGDSLSAADVERLGGEMAVLAEIHDPRPENEHFLRLFERQLRELVGCSLRLRKPIVF